MLKSLSFIALSFLLCLLGTDASQAKHKGGCLADMFRAAGVSEDSSIAYEKRLKLPVRQLTSLSPLVFPFLGVRSVDAYRFHNCFGQSSKAKKSSKCKTFRQCTGHGQCLLAKRGNAKTGHYACSCAPGYSGPLCQRDVCHKRCQNGGKCRRLSTGKRFRCQCRPGYTGEECQTAINKCMSKPCANGGSCSPLPNDFVCSCKQGFSGKQCQDHWLEEKTFDGKLLNAVKRLESRMSSVESGLKTRMSSVASALRKGIAAVDSGMKKRMSTVESGLKKRISHLAAKQSKILDAVKLLPMQGKDCRLASKQGVRTLFFDFHAFQAFCDMKTDGGGWTVIQRRQDGSVDFYRGWSDYKKGFGSLRGEFWLGLEKIYWMTSSGKYQLRIDMVQASNGKKHVVRYSSFSIGSESDGYPLHVSGFSSPTGASDRLAYHNNQKFSTKDRDNDRRGSSCAKVFTGAWWYNDCYHSNLNGRYGQSGDGGVVWNGVPQRFVEMKIRRV